MEGRAKLHRRAVKESGGNGGDSVGMGKRGWGDAVSYWAWLAYVE